MTERMVRLWHDDVRPAPQGWEWARTNEAAQAILSTGLVVEASLDHDLGLHDVELPDETEARLDAVCMRGQGSETGEDLARWMVERGFVPPKVRIHSWNPAGGIRMAALLAEAGAAVAVRPYDPKGEMQ